MEEPPKKKARKKRAPSADDMPAPPPPMKTIRLEVDLTETKEGETLFYFVLDQAKDLGMVDEWPADVAGEEVGMEVDEEGPIDGSMPIPSTIGLGFDGDAEEIARRFEERYQEEAKPKRVSDTHGRLGRPGESLPACSHLSVNRICNMTLRTHSSTTPNCIWMHLLMLLDLRNQDFM
jgi:hypothetical protein